MTKRDMKTEEVAKKIRRILADQGIETGQLTDDQLIDGAAKAAEKIMRTLQRIILPLYQPQIMSELKKMADGRNHRNLH